MADAENNIPTSKPVFPETEKSLRAYISGHNLPPSFYETTLAYYLPLADQAARWAENASQPLIIGINGAQGTGKSTLAGVLALLLKCRHGLTSAQLSIDDLYLTRAERNKNAAHIHPLLATRGVPGTHDTRLGVSVLYDLKAGMPCTIPRFDKSTDDRTPENKWLTVNKRVDVILFEGWCVGAVPEPQAALLRPVNALEESDDPDAAWRSYVNRQLSEGYEELFALIDKLILIKAPDFECVYTWRLQQELQLAARAGEDAPGVMNPQQLSRFIMHYERLTRWMLREMPERADILFELARDHTIAKAHGL